MLLMNPARTLCQGFFVPVLFAKQTHNGVCLNTFCEGLNMRQRQNTADTQEPIQDGSTYPQDAFMRAAGWGRHALRQARSQGLRVVKVGGRNFIRGRDFSEFLSKLADADGAQ